MIFNAPQLEAIWKYCGKKEKMLVTSIFYISHYVFNPIKDNNNNFSQGPFIVCHCFQFGPVQNFVTW